MLYWIQRSLQSHRLMKMSQPSSTVKEMIAQAALEFKDVLLQSATKSTLSKIHTLTPPGRVYEGLQRIR